jgi:hypothetical protein
VAAAAGLHLIVLTLLVWRLGISPELPETPVINVELVPRRPPPETPTARRPQRPRAGEVVGSAPSPPILTRPPVAVGEAAPQPGGEAVQQTLRDLLGCQPATLARLSPEARRRCEERLAAADPRDLGRAAARLNLDLHGEYARNPEAYLNRRPKNGCKARAAGDATSPKMPKEGPAAGVDCAWGF